MCRRNREGGHPPLLVAGPAYGRGRFAARGGLFLCARLLLLVLAAADGLGSPRAEILSPRDGSVLCASEPLKMDVWLQGMRVPSQGYGSVFLDEQLIATMEDSQMALSADDAGSLGPGQHRLSVYVYAADETPTGVEDHSLFTVLPGEDCFARSLSEQGGAGGNRAHARGVRAVDAGGALNRLALSCEIDPSRSSVSGDGIRKALAGVQTVFEIQPRDSGSGDILPELCPGAPDMAVTIVPGPFEHSMVRELDGAFVCSWTAEYVGMVSIEITVASTGQHYPGSPFRVTVGPTHELQVLSEFSPPPWAFGGRMLHTSRERLQHTPAVSLGTPLVVGGGDDDIKALCGKEGQCAYATLLSDDSYLTGALTLLFSVRRTGSSIDFVAMVTQDQVSHSSRRALLAAGFVVHDVERMRKSDASDMSEARWNDNYTKLRTWQLPYKKVIFMDSDMVVLQPIGHLFALKEDFSAVPDAFHPCYLNTGFMVLTPREETFQSLARLIEHVSSEESEQTLINHWFLDRWRPLHYTYNFAKHSVVSPTRHEIFVDRYMDTVKVVHFLGVKPWLCSRERNCMRHVPHYAGESNDYLHNLWWSIFDEMCDQGDVKCSTGHSEYSE